jgi:hypothetical protein
MMIRSAVILLCAVPATLFAQGRATTDAARARAALAPLVKLVGEWEGDARVSLVPGAPPQTAKQRYEITTEAGGTMMRVKGVARSADGTAKGGLFEANAVVWFDQQQNRLRMMARQVQGDSVEATIEVRPDTLIWGFPIQAGRVRFTIAYTSTDWHEVGHFIRDGAPPFQAVEMRLKKIK